MKRQLQHTIRLASRKATRSDSIPATESVINRGQVPSYLHNSDFYQSLNPDDNETFSIPEANLKLNTVVSSLDDLSHLLRTLEFWGVKPWPGRLVLFLCDIHSRQFKKKVHKVLKSVGYGNELVRVYLVLQELHAGSEISSAAEVYRDAAAALLPMLLAENETEAQQAAVALCKIAAVHFPARAYVMSVTDFGNLDQRVRSSEHVEFVRQIAKLLTVLWTGQASVSLKSTRATLPLLVHLLSSPGEETVSESCAGIAAVCEGPGRVKSVVHAGVVPRLIELLESTHDATQRAALLAVARISEKRGKHTKLIVKLGVLPALLEIWNSSDKDWAESSAHKEACGILHDIVLSGPHTIQAIVDAGLFPELIASLSDDESKVKSDIIDVLCDVTNYGSFRQLKYLVDQEVVSALCSFVADSFCVGGSDDVDLVTRALECLGEILGSIEKNDTALISRILRSMNEEGDRETLEIIAAMGSDAGPTARGIIDSYFVGEFYFVDVHDLMEQFGVPYEKYRDLL